MESKHLLTSNLQLLVALSVLMLVVVTFTALSNITVLLAIVWSRRKAVNNSITKMLMASMIISDLIFTVLIIPDAIVILINNGLWMMGPFMCTLWLDVNVIVCTVGGWHIFCMAVDKYLAVCRPLLYRILSNKLGLAMIIVSWVIPTVTLLLPKIDNTYSFQRQDNALSLNYTNVCVSTLGNIFFTSYMAALFYLPLTITYILYALILIDIRRYLHRMSAYSKNVSNKNNYLTNENNTNEAQTNTGIDFLGLTHFPSQNKNSDNEGNNQNVFSPVKFDNGRDHLPKHIKIQAKSIRTIGSVVAAFTICWMPPSILFLVLIQNVSKFSNVDYLKSTKLDPTNSPHMAWVVIGAYFLSFMTATVNPFLFCRMNLAGGLTHIDQHNS
ncbi:hypothetical protein Btru_064043 [Bulinus truncatus]|nr:hypothetical protein Btru_064043 [Bulinus truncatus]